MKIQNLELFRAKDKYLYEALSSIQTQTGQIETQGNFNATGNPPVPPPIGQLVVTTGPSGEFQITIHDSGEFGRGNNYFAEHDTSPAFSNPHVVDMGQSRNHSIYLGNQKLYWRAYSASISGSPSSPAYHGGNATPKAVQGGIPGNRAPSQGSGTGAPGVGLLGPGPVQTRGPKSGYNHKAQTRTAGTGFPGTGTPAGNAGSNVSPSGGGGGGGGGVVVTEAILAAAETLTVGGSANAITGSTPTPYTARAKGFVIRLIPTATNTNAVTINDNAIGAVAITKNGTTALSAGELQNGRTYFLMWDGTRYQIVEPSFPISAAVLGSSSAGVPVAVALAPNKIFIGSAGSLPVAQTMSGDATLAAGGALALITVNASPGTYTNATVVVDAQGRSTSVTSGTGGGPPSGAAGGDLDGTYPNPGVGAVNGLAVPSNVPIIGTNGSGQFVKTGIQGSARFTAGIGAVATGFTTLDSAHITLTASGPGFTEFVGAGNALVAGSLAVFSSDITSTSFFFYEIFGH